MDPNLMTANVFINNLNIQIKPKFSNSKTEQVENKDTNKSITLNQRDEPLNKSSIIRKKNSEENPDRLGNSNLDLSKSDKSGTLHRFCKLNQVHKRKLPIWGSLKARKLIRKR
jgi:hypothetical protein